MISKLLFAGVLVLSALSVCAELSLVATTAQGRFTQFEVRNGEIYGASSKGEAERLPAGTSWGLQGDLLAHANMARFSADYTIAKAVVSTGDRTKETKTFGTVFLNRTDDWDERDLEGAIAVMGWVRNGQLQWVEVEPARVTNGPSWAHAAMFVRELRDGENEGYPVLFVLKDGQFMSPKREFSDEAINRIMAAGHLGTAEEFVASLAATETLDVRSTETGLSVLGMIAKTGRLDLVKLMLGNGATIDSKAYDEHTALAAAAMLGRVSVVEQLMLSASTEEVADMCENLLPVLAKKKQLDSAMVLISAGFRKDANLVLQLALSLRDSRVAKQLLAMGIQSPLYGVEPEALIAASSTGDAELLQRLVEAGMRVSTKGDRSTVLIGAVQSGDVGAVEVLLKAKSKPESQDSVGFRAIDYATAAGNREMVQLLQRYGAAPARSDILPDPLGSVGRIYSEGEVDRIPVLLESTAPVGSPVVAGNALIAGTSLGRSFQLPVLYFRSSAENRLVRKRFSDDGADKDPHVYTGPSLYGAVAVVVDKDGTIADIDVIPYVGNVNRLLAFSSDDDNKQIAEVLAHRFVPGRLNGEPVATRVTLPLLVHDY